MHPDESRIACNWASFSSSTSTILLTNLLSCEVSMTGISLVYGHSKQSPLCLNCGKVAKQLYKA